jgi:hypothetical protein
MTEKITMRRYLITKVLMDNPGTTNIFVAIEAVSSTAIEHPEWDLEEERTWEEWEKNSTSS